MTLAQYRRNGLKQGRHMPSSLKPRALDNDDVVKIQRYLKRHSIRHVTKI